MKFTPCCCDCTGKLIKVLCKIFNFTVEVSAPTCSECCCDHIQDGEFGVCGLVAIIKYLGLKAQCACYYERDIKQIALVDSGLAFADAISHNACLLHEMCTVVDSKLFQANYAKKLQTDLTGMLTVLNDKMSCNTYYVNERISLADFYLVHACYGIFSHLFTKEEVTAQFPHVLRHCHFIAANFSAVAEIMGEVKFAASTFVIKANKTEKPKEEKPAPKAEKKAKKEEEEEDDEPKAPKAPANNYVYSFDLNAWKRHYKNLNWETSDWQDYFYEHFNPAEMSLWFLEYQYPETCIADWKTKNLFSILLQRVRGNKCDKHSFGVMAVTKKPSENHFNIVSVFLWPGKEVLPEWADVDGTASYKHTRLDNFQDPEVKQLIKNVWDWTEEKDIIFQGKNFGPTTGDCETFV